MSSSYADVVPSRLYGNARSYGSRAVSSEAPWAQCRAPKFPRAVWTLEAAPKQGERTEEVRTSAQRTPQWKKGVYEAGNRCWVQKRPMAGRRSQPSAQGLVARRKQRGPATGADAQERLRRSQPCQDINCLARARPFACPASPTASGGRLAWASAHYLQRGDCIERRLLSQVAQPLCNLGQASIWP